MILYYYQAFFVIFQMEALSGIRSHFHGKFSPLNQDLNPSMAVRILETLKPLHSSVNDMNHCLSNPPSTIFMYKKPFPLITLSLTQHPMTKNFSVQNVSSVSIEKLWFKVVFMDENNSTDFQTRGAVQTIIHYKIIL